MKQTAPLTQSQFGVFAECMQNPESDLYQLSYLLTLEKDMDLERLCDDHHPDFVRLMSAGHEAEVQAVRNLQSNEFFYH